MPDACIHVVIEGGKVIQCYHHIDDLIRDLNPSVRLVLHFSCDTVYTKDGFIESHPLDIAEVEPCGK